MKSSAHPVWLGVIWLAVATPVAASGVNLSWSGCATTPASGDLVYACDGKLGASVALQGSFRSPTGLPDFAGLSAYVDIGFQNPIPDFWRTQSGGCAAGLLQPAYPDIASPCTGANLFDPAYSGIVYSSTDLSPYRMRFRIDAATTSPSPPVVATNLLYGAFKLDLSVDSDVGAGCAGCSAQACLLVQSISLFGLGTGEYFTIENQDVRAFVTWQGGAAPTIACPAIVPTRNETWGEVKSLYR